MNRKEDGEPVGMGGVEGVVMVVIVTMCGVLRRLGVFSPYKADHAGCWPRTPIMQRAGPKYGNTE